MCFVYGSYKVVLTFNEGNFETAKICLLMVILIKISYHFILKKQMSFIMKQQLLTSLQSASEFDWFNRYLGIFAFTALGVLVL